MKYGIRGLIKRLPLGTSLNMPYINLYNARLLSYNIVIEMFNVTWSGPIIKNSGDGLPHKGLL